MRSVLLAVSLALCACRAPPYEEVSVDFDAGVARAKSRTVVEAPGVLRVSVAAIQSPVGTWSGYSKLLATLGAELGLELRLVQRRTYRETNELLTRGAIDLAFICTGGYFDLLDSGARIDVLAVPVVRGATTYESLIIVPAASPVRRLEDLAGKRFAFTDELSLSGHAWPMYAVRQAGLEPRRFFTASYFTHSHDRSVEAVARGFVDGAAVDSNIFTDMVASKPELATQVRVVQRSPPLGIPPVVALESLDPGTRARLREALRSFHQRLGSAELLAGLGIERFVAPTAGLYDFAFTVAKGGSE